MAYMDDTREAHESHHTSIVVMLNYLYCNVSRRMIGVHKGEILVRLKLSKQ